MFLENSETVSVNTIRIPLFPSLTTPKKDNYVCLVNADNSIGDLKHIRYKDNDFKALLNSYSFKEDTILKLENLHPTFCLIFVLSEDLDCLVNKLNEVILPKHHYNLVYLPVGEVEFKLKAGKQYDFLRVDFTIYYLESLDPYLNLSKFLLRARNDLPFLLRKEFFQINQANQFLQEIVMEMFRGIHCQRMHLRTQFHGLVEKSLGQGGNEDDKESVLFNNIKQHIIDNLATVTVASVKGKFHLSPLFLRLLIKKKAGVKPIEFIIDCRLQEGMSLLNQDITLFEIARRVGYSDHCTFSKAFLKKFKRWPAQFRSSLKNINIEKSNDKVGKKSSHSFSFN